MWPVTLASGSLKWIEAGFRPENRLVLMMTLMSSDLNKKRSWWSFLSFLQLFISSQSKKDNSGSMTSGSSLVVPMVMWGPRAPTHCISAIYLLRDQRTLVSGAADGQVIFFAELSVVPRVAMRENSRQRKAKIRTKTSFKLRPFKWNGVEKFLLKDSMMEWWTLVVGFQKGFEKLVRDWFLKCQVGFASSGRSRCLRMIGN